MTALPKYKKYTAKEYLALEEKAEYRSEFEDGEIIAMAGSSVNHARIITNVNRLFSIKLKQICESFTSDIKVCIEELKKIYYPDVIVICSEPKFYQKRTDTITNPVLIVEVLSKSTESKDRGEKLLAYRSLESLREYVLVSQTKPIVEQYTKDAGGNWIHKATIGLKSLVEFESVKVILNLEEIYRRVEFNPENL